LKNFTVPLTRAMGGIPFPFEFQTTGRGPKRALWRLEISGKVVVLVIGAMVTLPSVQVRAQSLERPVPIV
jgi:hypothetical protein